MPLLILGIALVAVLYGLTLLRARGRSDMTLFFARFLGGLLTAFGAQVWLSAAFGSFQRTEPGILALAVFVLALWPSVQAARGLLMRS